MWKVGRSYAIDSGYKTHISHLNLPWRIGFSCWSQRRGSSKRESDPCRERRSVAGPLYIHPVWFLSTMLHFQKSTFDFTCNSVIYNLTEDKLPREKYLILTEVCLAWAQFLNAQWLLCRFGLNSSLNNDFVKMGRAIKLHCVCIYRVSVNNWHAFNLLCQGKYIKAIQL